MIATTDLGFSGFANPGNSSQTAIRHPPSDRGHRISDLRRPKFPALPRKRAKTCQPQTSKSSDHQELCTRLMERLAESGYPLLGIRCVVDQSSLQLSGMTSRYFYLQMAILIARQLADGRHIDLRIKVTSPPTYP